MNIEQMAADSNERGYLLSLQGVGCAHDVSRRQGCHAGEG